MKTLHSDVASTAVEMTIKENEAFRVRLEKHEVVSPKGLYSIDIIQETLKDSKVSDSQTYNFFMTKDELQTLAHGLTT
jgi:hypothetical protein